MIGPCDINLLQNLNQSLPWDSISHYSEEGVLETEFGLDLSLFLILLRNVYFYFQMYPKSVPVLLSLF